MLKKVVLCALLATVVSATGAASVSAHDWAQDLPTYSEPFFGGDLYHTKAVADTDANNDRSGAWSGDFGHAAV